jgi:hypothetical protein
MRDALLLNRPKLRRPMAIPDADFRVQIDVHLEFADGGPPPSSAYQIAATSDFANGLQLLPALESKLSFNMTASKDSVQLWWPNGMGAQPMYLVQVAITKVISFQGDSLLGTRRRLNDADTYQWIQKRIGKSP